MSYFRFFMQILLLATVPSFLVYPQAPLPMLPPLRQVSLKAPTSSYDEMLDFLEKVEEENIEETLSLEEIEKINTFLALLAKEGALKEEEEEEIFQDTQDLFYPEEPLNPALFSFEEKTSYFVVPSLLDTSAEALLCKKSWLKKNWKKTKDFVKKHKKEILVGVVVVAATTAVVVAVVAASSAGAAAGGALGAAGASFSGGTEPQSKETSAPQKEEPFSSPEVPGIDPTLLGLQVKEEILSWKQMIAQTPSLQPNLYSSPDTLPWRENGRVVGSLLAHESIEKLVPPIPSPDFFSPSSSLTSTEEVSYFQGVPHQEVDRQFATSYTPFLPTVEREASWDSFRFQCRGEKALDFGQYGQAVQDFDQALVLGAPSPFLYLERGFANFHLGDYESSLRDYQAYTEQAPSTDPFSFSEFSRGFVKGLPQGFTDSNKELLLFLTDLVVHPVQTGKELWEAFSHLSSLAKTNQWGEIAQAIVPEAHQVISQWDTLPSEEKGEQVGYIIAKYGTDLIIPGAAGKLISEGIKGSKELSSACKNLRTAERMLVMESVAPLESGAKVGEALYTTQRTLYLAEELGLSSREIVQLKNMGHLEKKVTYTFQCLDPKVKESVEIHRNAREFLKPHLKKPMPEERIRDLIHQTYTHLP